MKPREIESLIQAAFDGLLSPSDEARLAEAMRRSPEARECYCQYALLIGELKRQASAQPRRPGQISAASRFAIQRSKRRQALTSVITAAALIALVAGMLARVFIGPEDYAAGLAVTPGSILFDGSREVFEGDSLEIGKPLTLRQGLVELRLHSGVRGVIEGPAECQLTSRNSLNLTGGRGYFEVPKSGRGFQVKGANISVTDLGTEFGVDFREGEAAGVEVMRGEVEVRSRSGRRDEQIVRGGRAVTVSGVGALKAVESLDGPFFKELPRRLPRFVVPFDEIQGGNQLALEGELSEGRTMVIGDPEAVRLAPGKRGQALEFVGDTELRSDWLGIPGDIPRTVAVWVKFTPESDSRKAPPFAVWGYLDDGWNRKFKLASAQTAEGQTVARASFGRYYVNGVTPLEVGRWHHLAIVFRGNDIHDRPRYSLYLNGRPEPSVAVAEEGGAPFTDVMTAGRVPLSLGRYHGKPKGGPLYFRGFLDDLQIVAGALSAEEIAALASGADE